MVKINSARIAEDNGDPSDMLRLATTIFPLLTKRYHKDNVCLTYETISDWYDQNRRKDLFEKNHLDFVIEQFPAGGSILDLGCGTGQPIAEYFIKNAFHVTGIDGSQTQIAKANKLVPAMKSICCDMRAINLNQTFNCIIAWHSFFHLSQADQRAIFSIFKKHIQPGGILVFTSGTEASELWSDNGGEVLYHASLSETEYRSLLNKNHFDVLRYVVKDPDCGGATIWIAKYTGNIA